MRHREQLLLDFMADPQFVMPEILDGIDELKKSLRSAFAQLNDEKKERLMLEAHYSVMSDALKKLDDMHNHEELSSINQ